MKLNKQEYLYGQNIIVPNVPSEVANERIRLLNKNLHQLLEVNYRQRDNIRIDRVMKAIDFWKDLSKGEGIMMDRNKALSFASDPVQKWNNVRVYNFVKRIYDDTDIKTNSKVDGIVEGFYDKDILHKFEKDVSKGLSMIEKGEGWGIESEPTDKESDGSFEKKLDDELLEIGSMLLDKNRKYGDSALNPQRIFSKANAVEQIKVRIDDKLSRMTNQQDDEDEDVVKDLLGYLILLRIAKKVK